MGVAATCRCLRLAGARAASKPLACSTAAARLHPPCVPAPGWCGFAALQRDKQCRQNIGKYRRKGWLVMREHASCAWECDVGGYAWARAGRPEARTCLGNVPSNPLALRCSRARCGAATTWVGGSRALAQAGWSMIVSACAASGCCGSCCWCCCASPRLHQALPQLEHFVLHLQQGVEEVLQERGGGGQSGSCAAAVQQPVQPACQRSYPTGHPAHWPTHTHPQLAWLFTNRGSPPPRARCRSASAMARCGSEAPKCCMKACVAAAGNDGGGGGRRGWAAMQQGFAEPHACRHRTPASPPRAAAAPLLLTTRRRLRRHPPRLLPCPPRNGLPCPPQCGCCAARAGRRRCPPPAPPPLGTSARSQPAARAAALAPPTAARTRG